MMAVIVKTNMEQNKTLEALKGIMEHQKLLTAIDKSGYTPENCTGTAATVYVSKWLA